MLRKRIFPFRATNIDADAAQEVFNELKPIYQKFSARCAKGEKKGCVATHIMDTLYIKLRREVARYKSEGLI